MVIGRGELLKELSKGKQSDQAKCVRDILSRCGEMDCSEGKLNIKENV